ncbi:carboxypeptidase-like regulatory domain-containing protein [Polaribacter tangerinus]|uniref:carboxypeptidase-like regulatory domain-containing protein n=1 Tax=Polaribacter tangerinus TaxID=1920034 RepID=UPI000B4B2133
MIILNNKFYKIFFYSLFITQNLFTQSLIKYKGKILDNLNQPISYANIIAEPKGNTNIKYTFSDENGNFELSLMKGITYNISITCLGFKKKKIKFTANKNFSKNYILEKKKRTSK